MSLVDDSGAVASVNRPSNIKRRKVAVRDFPSHYWIVGFDVKNTTSSNGVKCVAAIPNVPLESFSSNDVKRDLEKSLTSHEISVDVGQETTNGNESKVGSLDETWKQDTNKLEAVIAQAKQYIKSFDIKYSTSLQNLDEKFDDYQTVGKSRKPKRCVEVCVLDDVSHGKEKMPMRAMNKVDNEKPPFFTYTTNIVLPHWYQHVEPVGCDCINGCSDSSPCPCVLKNGGEIPYNEKGAIIRAKPRVHECGLSCKCPPSCMNRVSQHGPRHQLEIFKTESRGWGVRSRNTIPSGSFICEYVGELLCEKEAELRVGKDEYLFDIYDDGFAIDAANYGNIGRFVNHSCSPNLFGQEVLYDHDDKRMPHIMFFANKKIYPRQELTYDYNYKMGRVSDAKGNIKTKACYCGSRKCTRRMY